MSFTIFRKTQIDFCCTHSTWNPPWWPPQLVCCFSDKW